MTRSTFSNGISFSWFPVSGEIDAGGRDGQPDVANVRPDLLIFFTATAAPAVWRGPPQMVAALDDETRDWVRGLRNNYGGSCCDTADGFPVEADGWDMAGTIDDTSAMTKSDAFYARSGYRVRLADGLWHDVPKFALIDPKTNKLGYAVV